MPLQVWPCLFPQVPTLHAAAMAPVQTPAVPPAQVGGFVQLPKLPLQLAGLGFPLQRPGSFLQVSNLALQNWGLRSQVCACVGPVCGHEGLVGSHQMMFSFS